MSMFPNSPKAALLAGLSLLFICVMVWGLRLESSADKASNWNYLFNVGYGIIYLAGSFVGIAGAFRLGLRKLEGKTLIFLGLSLLSQALGLFTWAYYNLILHVSIPSPSLGDIFLLVFFLPLVAAGFIYLLRASQASLNPFSITIAIVVFLLSLGIIFGIVERPDISSTHPLLVNLISVSYPFVDCILLSFSAYIVTVAPPRFRASFLVLVLGFLIQVSADLTYAIRVGQGSYWNGDVADKLYATAAFVLSLGVINLLFWYQGNIHTLAPTTASPEPISTDPIAPMPTIVV